jgi:hypothetical protein
MNLSTILNITKSLIELYNLCQQLFNQILLFFDNREDIYFYYSVTITIYFILNKVLPNLVINSNKSFIPWTYQLYINKNLKTRIATYNLDKVFFDYYVLVKDPKERSQWYSFIRQNREEYCVKNKLTPTVWMQKQYAKEHHMFQIIEKSILNGSVPII